MHALSPPCALIHSKAHSSHTHIIQASLSPLLLSLPATLPLGGVSWNGLKELAPCTWSALFTRPCMWAGRIVASPQSPSELAESIWGADRSGQPSVSQLTPVSHSHWGLFIRRPSFRLSGSFFFLTGHYITTDKWTHLFSLLFARRELSVFLSSYSRKREREKCWSSWFALWMKWRGAGHWILKDNLSTPPRDTHTVPPWLLLQFCESSEAPYADHSPGCWSQVFPWMLFPNGLEGEKSVFTQEKTDYEDFLLYSESYIWIDGL